MRARIPLVAATGYPCTAVGSMVFACGRRSGYDAWVSRRAKGWGFDDLLPYFQRSERPDDRVVNHTAPPGRIFPLRCRHGGRASVSRPLQQSQRYIGVACSGGRETVEVHCTQEMVRTAATAGSARLSPVSGIGPRDHLRGVGLDVAPELPGVGANLHDRPVVASTYRAGRPIPARPGSQVGLLGLKRSRGLEPLCMPRPRQRIRLRRNRPPGHRRDGRW
jgi:choline dehydrogenase-like flavoprotein